MRHFTLPLGNCSSVHLSARAALRAISAYLRTLAVARQFWEMPTGLAHEESLLALPLHPTLALLRPQRPDWFPALRGFDGDAESVEAAIRALLARVGEVRPGDELIAFSSPIVISEERCVEVSLVRWSQAAGSSVNDADLAAYLDAFWMHGPMFSSAASGPLNTTTTVVP